VSKGRRRRSLSQKYSIFTGLLLAYVIFIFVAYDVWADTFNPVKTTALALAALLIAGALSRYTNQLIGRPLRLLQEGITAVRQGRLEPIRISRTGDEIEFVGESFNAMIKDLTASRKEIRQHQEFLEERIRQRTHALEEVSKRALAANKAKSEFLANMSHELRTPMSGVLGMIDIVLDSKLDSAQRDQLLTAKSCADTLLALLNDILDLSKIEAGKMVLEEVPIQIRALADECVRSQLPKAREKGISLTYTAEPEVPSHILADPLRLRQIIANLLSNAVKFTDKGSVELKLALEDEMRGEQPILVLHVIDTGTGIPLEKQPTIFDEFTQADGSISRKYGGTGLGLAITRKLVQIHGGNIAVSSVPGKGSDFRVAIPCKPASAPAAAAVSNAVPAPSRVEKTPVEERPVILVVEDNPVNQKVVTAMLKRHGYGIAIANHGGEVEAVLESTPVSLVLMDLQMPVIDGLEATNMIRRNPRWRDLPIIAMTAHAMPGDRELCLHAGMNGYLAKPVSRPQLIAVIEKHLIDKTRGQASPQAPAACCSAGVTASPGPVLAQGKQL